MECNTYISHNSGATNAKNGNLKNGNDQQQSRSRATYICSNNSKYNAGSFDTKVLVNCRVQGTCTPCTLHLTQRPSSRNVLHHILSYCYVNLLLWNDFAVDLECSMSHDYGNDHYATHTFQVASKS